MRGDPSPLRVAAAGDDNGKPDAVVVVALEHSVDLAETGPQGVGGPPVNEFRAVEQTQIRPGGGDLYHDVAPGCGPVSDRGGQPEKACQQNVRIGAGLRLLLPKINQFGPPAFQPLIDSEPLQEPALAEMRWRGHEP